MNKDNQVKLSIGLLIVLVGFPQISETIYTPALPSVASGLNAAANWVEATLAIYFLGFAVGVSVWGIISDWCGRRKAMLAGIALYGIGTFTCGQAETVESLLAWRFVQAIGASVGSVITQTILRDAYDGAQRAKLFSILSGALAFSPAIGPILGGVISEFWGWRANFWALGLFAIAILLWSFKSLPETKPVHVMRPSLVQVKNLFKSMLSSYQMWGHIILIGATNGIIFGFYQEAPFIFIDQLGMRPSLYGLLGLLVAGALIVAARISYQFNCRFSPEKLVQLGAYCVLAGGIGLIIKVAEGIFTLQLIGLAGILLALFIVFFGIGLIIPNSLSVALKPYQSMVGTAGSIFGFCYYLLIAGLTWSLSELHNGTEWPLPLYIGALGLIIVSASQMIYRKKGKAPALEEKNIKQQIHNTQLG